MNNRMLDIEVVEVGEMLHEGEPFFLLRAGNSLTLPALQCLAQTLREQDRPDEAEDIEQICADFADWQRSNPECVVAPTTLKRIVVPL